MVQIASTTALITSGYTGVIASFDNDQLAGKLMAMGILPGDRIELIRKAPLGGGWYVKVGRQCVALRKQELACIKMK